jgi:hypothetical protein
MMSCILLSLMRTKLELCRKRARKEEKVWGGEGSKKLRINASRLVGVTGGGGVGYWKVIIMWIRIPENNANCCCSWRACMRLEKGGREEEFE